MWRKIGSVPSPDHLFHSHKLWRYKYDRELKHFKHSNQCYFSGTTGSNRSKGCSWFAFCAYYCHSRLCTLQLFAFVLSVQKVPLRKEDAALTIQHIVDIHPTISIWAIFLTNTLAWCRWVNTSAISTRTKRSMKFTTSGFIRNIQATLKYFLQFSTSNFRLSSRLEKLWIPPQ